MSSGFHTERNKRIKGGGVFKSDVTHEIDVYIKASKMSKPILIECKDVDEFRKEYVDSFFGKITDIKNIGSLFVTTNLNKKDTLKNFKAYCKRRGMFFLDGNELDSLVEKISSIKDIEKRKKYLLKSIGIKAKI